MKAKLDLLDRIALVSILPGEGNYLKLTTIKSIQKKIDVEQEELEENLDFFQGGSFKPKKDAVIKKKSYEFSDGEEVLIIGILKELEKTEKLKKEQYGVYGEFIIGEKKPEDKTEVVK